MGSEEKRPPAGARSEVKSTLNVLTKGKGDTAIVYADKVSAEIYLDEFLRNLWAMGSKQHFKGLIFCS